MKLHIDETCSISAVKILSVSEFLSINTDIVKNAGMWKSSSVSSPVIILTLFYVVFLYEKHH